MKKKRLFSILVISLLLFGFSISNAAKGEIEDRPIKSKTTRIDNQTDNSQTNQQNSQRTVTDYRNADNSNIISPPANPIDPTKSPQAGEQINWQVISGGGGTGTSTNYSLSFTLGQTAVGSGSSATYILNHGFWQEFMIGSSTCCINGEVGDANLSGDITVGDISAIVDQLFGTGTIVDCLDEGDANWSRSGANAIAEDITVGDISSIVNTLFGDGIPLHDCQ